MVDTRATQQGAVPIYTPRRAYPREGQIAWQGGIWGILR